MELLTDCKWSLRVVHEIIPESPILYNAQLRFLGFFISLSMFSTDVFDAHIFGISEVTGFTFQVAKGKDNLFIQEVKFGKINIPSLKIDLPFFFLSLSCSFPLFVPSYFLASTSSQYIW